MVDRRRSSNCTLLLALFVALATAGPVIVDAKVVPRPVALKTTTKRLVELPRNKLSSEQHHVDGKHDNNHGSSSSSSSSSTVGDILPSSPFSLARHVEVAHHQQQHGSLSTTPSVADDSDSVPNPRRQLSTTTTTTTTTTEEEELRHSTNLETLQTSYTGNITSSSLEFTVRNTRDDGRYAIISGLGLHVQIVHGGDDDGTAAAADGGADVPVPCRVKMYTKRNNDAEVAAAGDDAAADDADGAEVVSTYELALDTRVLCMGQGKETLVPSEAFLNYYRNKEQEEETTRKTATEGGGGGEGHRRTSLDVFDLLDIENPDHGTVLEITQNISTATTSTNVTTIENDGLTAEEERYPLLIPPDTTLSLYIVVSSPVEEEEEEDLTSPQADTTTTSFLLLSSNGGGADGSAQAGELGLTGTSLNLYTGTSIISGYLANNDDSDGSATITVPDEELTVVDYPTLFSGAIYYDTFDRSYMNLDEYYDNLEYSLLPGDALHHLPGCDHKFSTGFVDTVGSYGVMFDVTSAVTAYDGEDEEVNFLEKFKNVEIYGMDLYIRNLVKTKFEVHIRKNTAAKPHQHPNRNSKYMSYLEPSGQTLISQNWELIAKGTVEGQGPNVGSPIPPSAWRRNVIIPPGQTVGFYVTVEGAPDLRYRNTTRNEGDMYVTDDILNIIVGRSWGEYPLRGDGTDVYFSPREFSGGFHYHVHEGLCETFPPSVAPSFNHDSDAPSVSLAPSAAVGNSYAGSKEAEGMCLAESDLATTFEDGTGSYGALFDIQAMMDLTLTGIDLNMDWNTGTSAHLLIYAREGSWFGHQNNADSWPHLIVNTTIHRPDDFHNRTADGPYIPIEHKMDSAIVPRKAFKPLPIKMGDTWSFYVCTSIADFRYRMGTSIGKTFASNDELRIMEGAGAADYPPFMGGTPEKNGVEYTFYAPRVFNGNLRYDYVEDCPSDAPSSAFSTPEPTGVATVPILTTSVSYTFYVEHSPDKLMGAVTYDMSFGVRDVLDQMGWQEGSLQEDILYGHVMNDDLMIERVDANLVSPTEIGYLCYPTPPETCTPISVDVTATHRSTASVDEITYALLRQSTRLPSLISVDGYTIEYVGDRAVETNSEITLGGIPDREMGESEQEFFENAARDFLRNQVLDDSENDSLRILSVTINGQDISSDDDDKDDTILSTSVMPVRNNYDGRRLEKKSNKLKVSVKGKYRPPPEVDFGEIIETSINRDRELLEKELKKPPALQENGEGAEESNYFAETEVVGAREIKEEKPAVQAATFVVPQGETNDDGKALLHFAAIAVGGLIFLLSAAFILRPHRRRAMFGGSDSHSHRRTQPVDIEDEELLKKGRFNGFTGSGTSGASSMDKHAYDPRASNNSSERMLGFSGFESGQPPDAFDPRGSGASARRGQPPDAFDPRGSGTSARRGQPPAFDPRGSSFPGDQPPAFDPRGSSFPGDQPPGFDPRGSGTSGRSGQRPRRGSSYRGGQQPGFDPRGSGTSARSGQQPGFDPRGSGTSSRGGHGDAHRSFNRGEQHPQGIPEQGSFAPGPNSRQSNPFRGPPGQNSPHNSMTRGGAPPPHGPMNHSMPPRQLRGGGPRRPSHDHHGSMPPRRLTGGEGGPRQMQDPRRNPHDGYR